MICNSYKLEYEGNVMEVFNPDPDKKPFERVYPSVYPKNNEMPH